MASLIPDNQRFTYHTFSKSALPNTCSLSEKLLLAPGSNPFLPIRRINPIGVTTKKKISVNNTALLTNPINRDSPRHTQSIFSLSQKENTPANPITRAQYKNTLPLNTRYRIKNPTVMTNTVSLD